MSNCVFHFKRSVVNASRRVATMSHVKYAKSHPFHKANAPIACGCSVGVSSRGKTCTAIPTYLIVDENQWVCGRHLKGQTLPDCSICLCKLKNKKDSLPCGHVFHRPCLAKWERTSGKNTCPLCRASYRDTGCHRPAYAPEYTARNGNRPLTHVPALPSDVEIVYTDLHDDIGIMPWAEAAIIELSHFGQIGRITIQAFDTIVGPGWPVSFSQSFCAPVNNDGTANWSAINFNHRTAELIRRVRGPFSIDLFDRYIVLD
jgi:hypothetical protein